MLMTAKANHTCFCLAAAGLHQRIEEMRMELFVLKLVRPEEGEEDILHL